MKFSEFHHWHFSHTQVTGVCKSVEFPLCEKPCKVHKRSINKNKLIFFYDHDEFASCCWLLKFGTNLLRHFICSLIFIERWFASYRSFDSLTAVYHDDYYTIIWEKKTFTKHMWTLTYNHRCWALKICKTFTPFINGNCYVVSCCWMHIQLHQFFMMFVWYAPLKIEKKVLPMAALISINFRY